MDNNKDTSKNPTTRNGRCLAHGKEAHANDHRKWSRRDFLGSGLLAAGSAFMLGGSPLKAMQPSPLLKAIENSDNEKVLVIINMDGGNDGLNMVVPRGNDTYYNLRPTLAVQEANMFALDTDYGMPNYMNDLQSLWGDGKMGVIHSVAYPAQNYSHFRSADIWNSASDSLQVLNTGWIGRFMDYEYPAYNDAPVDSPVGLQIGVQSSLVFMGGESNFGLTINNPTQFYQIAETGQLYNTDSLPDCSYGEELGFMRTMANNTFRYAGAIKDTYNNATNGTYPTNDLAEQLTIVARLIKGGLKTKVFLVHLGGFDTHGDQPATHPQLLTDIATSVKAFYDDLTAAGRIGDVLTLTVSEFGRTAGENGSFGTDHGQAAPLMIFGENITGGFKGTFGEISTISYGDQAYTTDFRSVYATILKDWFCIAPVVVNAIMGRAFPLVADLLPNCTSNNGSHNLAVLLGHNPDPTDFSTILIKYAILARGYVRLQILNTAGQALATIVDGPQEANAYTVGIKASDYGLPPGEYVYRLQTGGKNYSRKIMLVG